MSTLPLTGDAARDGDQGGVRDADVSVRPLRAYLGGHRSKGHASSGERLGAMSWDDRMLAARLVSWLCCRQTYYATRPENGCIRCR
jgi:hypothetical protein